MAGNHRRPCNVPSHPFSFGVPKEVTDILAIGKNQIARVRLEHATRKLGIPNFRDGTGRIRKIRVPNFRDGGTVHGISNLPKVRDHGKFNLPKVRDNITKTRLVSL